jgi:hypothetical protein
MNEGKSVLQDDGHRAIIQAHLEYGCRMSEKSLIS